MKEILYACVGLIAKVHDYIMHLNDAFELSFTDKQMHFLVIGILGMAMIFVIYPLFKFLAKRNHEMVIAWIYVFTVIVVITFAIEIGQRVTGTGNMEFADIVFGLMGFIIMFFVFSLIRMLYHGALRLIRYLRTPKEERGNKMPTYEELEDLPEEQADQE